MRIDFVQAQDLWDDPDHVEVPARTVGESRWLVVGCISDVHWSAVIAYRNRRVRIISVRRSRGEEVKVYAEDEY
ncbi:MAG: BrnT family toxin [Acidimicrobiales bacterium]